MTNYDKYIRKTAIYCNDRSVGGGTYSISSSFFYGGYTRLDSNKLPSYKCGANTSNGLFEATQAIEDKFSASTRGGGNGQLTYPIALMTADEISFSGGFNGTSLSSPYAWYYTNSASGSITGTNHWWLLSPYRCFGSYQYVFHVIGSYNPSYLSGYDVNDTDAVRPVISISKCAKVKSGIGTPDSPYEIDENSCN